MSIPLVRNNTKDAINTSIIAIKKNLERINSLLGLMDNSDPDLSGLATKQELENAVTEINNTIDEVETSLQPVDTVTSGDMHSVTSNAVASALGGIHFVGSIVGSQSSRTYYKINNFLSYSVTTGGVFLLQSRGGELCLLSAGRSDASTIPKVKRLLNTYTKILGFTYSGTTLYIALEQWANFLTITQIGGNERKDVTISTATQSEYNSGTAITIET